MKNPILIVLTPRLGVLRAFLEATYLWGYILHPTIMMRTIILGIITIFCDSKDNDIPAFRLSGNNTRIHTDLAVLCSFAWGKDWRRLQHLFALLYRKMMLPLVIG